MRTCILCAFAIAALVAVQVNAASAVFSSPTMRVTTAAEVGGGAPAGGIVNEYRVTTDADILTIHSVVITASPLYQNAFGTDNEPPNPAIVAVIPAAGADSWISTPGATSIAGTGFGDPNSVWFDVTNNGPQTNFMFARLTVPGDVVGTFSGTMDINGAAGPESFPFSLPVGVVPEPAAVALLGIGLLGVMAQRRRRA